MNYKTTFISCLYLSLFILGLTSGLHHLRAQSWLEIDTKYYFNAYGQDGPDGDEYLTYERVDVLGDTIVNGQSCVYATLNHAGGFVRYVYLYEAEETVYVFSQYTNQFELYYDINSEVGDSWQIERFDLPLENLTITVLENFTTEINGINLKALRVRVQYTPGDVYEDTIIERIGFLGMFVPKMPGIIDGDYRGLRCFEDSYIGFYSFLEDDNLACDYVPVTTNTEILKSLKEEDIPLFPNPFHDEITLDFQVDLKTPTAFDIIDSRGQVVYHGTLNNDVSTYNLSHLASGIYFLKLTIEDRVLSSIIVKK